MTAWSSTPIGTGHRAHVEHPRPEATAVEHEGQWIVRVDDECMPVPVGPQVSMSGHVLDMLPGLSAPALRMLVSCIRACRWARPDDRPFVDMRVRHKRNGEREVVFSPVEGTRGHRVWRAVPTAAFTPPARTMLEWLHHLNELSLSTVDHMAEAAGRMHCEGFNGDAAASALAGVPPMTQADVLAAVHELARFGLVRRFTFDNVTLAVELSPELLAQMPAGLRGVMRTAVQRADGSVVTFSTDIATAREPVPPSRLTKADMAATIAALTDERDGAREQVAALGSLLDEMQARADEMRALMDRARAILHHGGMTERQKVDALRATLDAPDDARAHTEREARR